jgi:hypothetical protein
VLLIARYLPDIRYHSHLEEQKYGEERSA